MYEVRGCAVRAGSAKGLCRVPCALSPEPWSTCPWTVRLKP